MAQTEYEKAHTTYRELAKKAVAGDKQAHADKARAMNEIRAIEREAARSGEVLTATYKGDRVAVDVKRGDTKRSLQEEYVRKYDNDAVVTLGGKEQTLQQFHRQRLLGGK